MHDIILFSENGPIENLQVLVLLVAAIIFLKRATEFSRTDRTHFSSYCTVAALLPLLGTARELSFGRVLGMERDAARIVKLFIAALTLCLIAYAVRSLLRSTPRYIETFVEFLRHKSSIALYAAIACIGIAGMFEKGYLGLPESEIIEEVMELVAFLFILRAALIVTPDTRGPAYPATATPALTQ